MRTHPVQAPAAGVNGRVDESLVSDNSPEFCIVLYAGFGRPTFGQKSPWAKHAALQQSRRHFDTHAIKRISP